MEQYDNTTFAEESLPTIKEIEKRLRKLGCTKEQVKRHLDQVLTGRTEVPRRKSRQKR